MVTEVNNEQTHLVGAEWAAGVKTTPTQITAQKSCLTCIWLVDVYERPALQDSKCGGNDRKPVVVDLHVLEYK